MTNKSDNDKKEKEIGDKELHNLVSRLNSSFSSIVKKEEDLSNIVLKGHLLIENFLDELIAVFDLQSTRSIHKLTFNEKVEKIKNQSDKESDYMKNLMVKLTNLLGAINDVRNNLAHNYNFSLSELEIDKIGINLGSEYILQKYNIGHNNLKQNLLFCIEQIIDKAGLIIYHKICSVRELKNPK